MRERLAGLALGVIATVLGVLDPRDAIGDAAGGAPPAAVEATGAGDFVSITASTTCTSASTSAGMGGNALGRRGDKRGRARCERASRGTRAGVSIVAAMLEGGMRADADVDRYVKFATRSLP